MGHIIAFAGKKASGKTTASNFLHGHEIQRADMTGDWTYRINDSGQLVVRTAVIKDGKPEFDEGVLDVNQRSYKFVRYAENNIWPYIKAYNFAQILKDICVDVLGLDWAQCNGSDHDKNTLTQLRWEDMPGVISDKELISGLTSEEVRGRLGPYYERFENGLVFHEPGYMTGREVMQYVGTDIFRRMYGNVWVDYCINQIRGDESDIAVIGDCRFLNEVEAIKAAGGKVIKFTRNFDSTDGHLSENDLNDFDGFDAVVDNRGMGIEEQNAKVLELLVYWGITEFIRPKSVTSIRQP
jgi:hypothetical protein